MVKKCIYLSVSDREPDTGNWHFILFLTLFDVAELDAFFYQGAYIFDAKLGE